MKKKRFFECANCGHCCTDESTQINLTLLDIRWLSEYLNLSVKELFSKEIISFIPFMRTEDLSVFDVELGMKKPCNLRKDNKCGAYDARPVNCRTFPIWLINNNIPDRELSCINVAPDPITSLKYQAYERMVGKILFTEAEKTEKFMKSISAIQKIDFSDDLDYNKLKKQFFKSKDMKSEKLFGKKMMALAGKKLDKSLYSKIELIEAEINRNDFTEQIDTLINAEALLGGEVTSVNFGSDFQNP